LEAASAERCFERILELTVTANWRLIFRYDEDANAASHIDLIDYH